MMVKMSELVIKSVFIIFMLMLNTYLVSYHSISKFLDGSIMIEISTESSDDGILPPAVTIVRHGFDGYG